MKYVINKYRLNKNEYSMIKIFLFIRSFVINSNDCRLSEFNRWNNVENKQFEYQSNGEVKWE